MTGRQKLAYVALIVVNAALMAFSVELGAGRVPIPTELAWVVPVLGAALAALTTQLPRAGASDRRGR